MGNKKKYFELNVFIKHPPHSLTYTPILFWGIKKAEKDKRKTSSGLKKSIQDMLSPVVMSTGFAPDCFLFSHAALSFAKKLNLRYVNIMLTNLPQS